MKRPEADVGATSQYNAAVANYLTKAYRCGLHNRLTNYSKNWQSDSMQAMKITFFIISAIALFIVLAKFEAWQRTRKIEAVFGGREALDSEQFYERYFRQKGVPFKVVSGVKRVLEEQLQADMSRIIDSDDFSKDLKFFWDFDSMADVEIVCALEEMFNIKITDDEAKRSHTVSDIVFLVHAKISKISEA